MKRLYWITLVILSHTGLWAQSDAAGFGKISLSVVMPDNSEDLTVKNISKLETKIIHLVSNTGLAANGYGSDFVIYPKFEIGDSKVVESGMQDLVILECDLNLFIKQVANNVIYSSVSVPLKGSGKDRQAAIASAIGKVDMDSEKFKQFIDKGKLKILEYYDAICPDVMIKADGLIKMQQYRDAISVLIAVPDAVKCKKQAVDKSVQVFLAFQNQKCAGKIKEAKAHQASNNYEEALRILMEVDPASICYKEALGVINSIESKIDAELKQKLELQLMVYKDNLALERHRMDIMREIALAYYHSQPATINYLYLIR